MVEVRDNLMAVMAAKFGNERPPGRDRCPRGMDARN
jgi:hypothetical protein